MKVKCEKYFQMILLKNCYFFATVTSFVSVQHDDRIDAYLLISESIMYRHRDCIVRALSYPCILNVTEKTTLLCGPCLKLRVIRFNMLNTSF